MMEDAIRDFPKQFTYVPEVERADKLGKFRSYVVLGMGGSHLAADLLKVLDPWLDIVVHSDYGLPTIPEEDLHARLIIASSYSGNTEEVLDGFDYAVEKGYPLAAVAVGGKLQERAKAANIPFVKIPNTGVQPRSALGFSLRALMKLLRLETLLKDSMGLRERLDVDALEEDGKELAKTIKGKVPLIYSSRRNGPIAYNWKIKFNETGKIPAFTNVLPELNHNEMTGFDIGPKSKKLSEQFHVLMLRDESDHPQVKKRMRVLMGLLEEKGLAVTGLTLMGASPLERIFKSLLIADWAAFHTAKQYGLDPDQVPMVEEFKKLIR